MSIIKSILVLRFILCCTCKCRFWEHIHPLNGTFTPLWHWTCLVYNTKAQWLIWKEITHIWTVDLSLLVLLDCYNWPSPSKVKDKHVVHITLFQSFECIQVHATTPFFFFLLFSFSFFSFFFFLNTTRVKSLLIILNPNPKKGGIQSPGHGPYLDCSHWVGPIDWPYTPWGLESVMAC